MELKNVVEGFIGHESYTLEHISGGHINQTYLVCCAKGKLILQRLNTDIFKDPAAIISNHLTVNRVLENPVYSRKTVHVVPTLRGENLLADKSGGVWRMTEFIADSVSFLKAPDAATALEAAKCFSEFYALLNQEEIELKETLPGFINFKKRMDDFRISVIHADTERLNTAKEEIQFLESMISLPEKWLQLEKDGLLPVRTIHADPKISNILFNQQRQAVAIIDLDTVMASTLLYDFGDMVRSYCNLAEEDDDGANNNFSREIYHAVKEGFLSHLQPMLSEVEKENLDYAAQVVIYIQALRFLTDFLNGDVYYSVKYPHHNLDRARNQISLIKNLMKELHEIE